MKRVLVTGATGFIGRHSLSALQNHRYEVHATFRDGQKKPEESGVQWHAADLFDSIQISGLMSKVKATHLLHFAWCTTPGKYQTSLENIRWVQASLDLMQAFAANGGQRFVAAGTCFEYDQEYGYCSEKVTPLAPAMLYGVSKHSLWTLIDAFSRQTGLSAAWGRIFFLYGPFEYPQKLVASVIGSLLKGQIAACSTGDQVRDYLYVQDVADAFATLLDGGVTGSVNIASGKPISIRNLILNIAKHLGHSEDMLDFGAMPSPVDDPPLLVADTRRLENEVGWAPNYSLDHGLEQTIDWWKSQFQGGLQT